MCHKDTIIAIEHKSNVQKSRVRNLTKANTDLHNGNVKRNNKTSSYKPQFILNKIFCRHLTEIKAVWLVKREAGKAVC